MFNKIFNIIYPFNLSQESELRNLGRKRNENDQDIGDDSESEKSGSFHSHSLNLVESPEPSIRMVSPEPTALPFEFSNMRYSQLNKIILSMSSDVNDEEDDTESETRDVSGFEEEEKSSNDPFDDNNFDEEAVKRSSKDGEEEENSEIEDALPDLNLLKTG